MANPWNDPMQNIRDDDIPDNMEAGWKVNRRLYPQYNVAPGDRSADDVYTRHAGYAPYQSVVQNDGRHAYDSHHYQYPQSSDVGYAHGALDPAARRQEFMQNRSAYYVHLPGEQVVMGIDESQMRTQPMPAAAVPAPQQPMQQPMQQPIQQPMQQPMRRPIQQPIQQPIRPRPLPPRPTPVQSPIQDPMRGPMRGPVRAPAQGPPRGGFGARGAMGPPPLPLPAARGRGAGSTLRPARGGYGNPRGTRGRRR